MSVDKEISGEVLKRRKRREVWRMGGAVAVLVAAAIAGGKGGYELNQSERNSRDAADIAAAERNKRCFEISRNSYMVPVGEVGGPTIWINEHPDRAGIERLKSLSDQGKADCDLEDVEKQLEPWDGSRGRGISLPHDAEIDIDSVAVKLPTPQELQASAEENLRKSRETSVPEHFEVAAATGAGAVGGVIGASALGIGGLGLVGFAGAMGVAGRRRL